MITKKTHPLLDNAVLTVLDGDTICKEFDCFHGINNFEVNMPYLSCNSLITLASDYDIELDLSLKGQPYSRVTYMREIMQACLLNGFENNLLSRLFEFRNFRSLLLFRFEYQVEEYEQIYIELKKVIIDYLNSLLVFDNSKLIQHVDNIVFIDLSQTVTLDKPFSKKITVDYIKDLSERAVLDIKDYHFDSAVTKARTLVEEVLIYMIESKGEEPDRSGKTNRLYKQVKTLYDMHVQRDTDRTIKGLLSGLETIIQSLSELRNSESDSHGVGSKRITLDETHARLAVNASMTISEFLISITDNN